MIQAMKISIGIYYIHLKALRIIFIQTNTTQVLPNGVRSFHLLTKSLTWLEQIKNHKKACGTLYLIQPRKYNKVKTQKINHVINELKNKKFFESQLSENMNLIEIINLCKAVS